MIEARAREALERYSGLLAARGWVANHDGNLSARVASNRVVCTPTATHKRDVTQGELVVTDTGGKKLSGRKGTPGEYGLHLAVYRARADVGAVVHAHPPFATALGCSGRELVSFLPEAVVSLGKRVPLVPLAAPGPAAVAALGPFFSGFDAVLVQGNGVFAWGDDVEQAFLRLELVEHLATIATHAAPWGGPPPLASDLVDKLLEARRKAFPDKA
ncbi:MAG: class II aldolase/adducin family protein [Deltaproteobacteria bacterium]|nr:class II aldolase/adducin family protein [Deltaproteobacteria bacterium]